MTEFSDQHREYLFEPFERILMVRQVEQFKLLDLLCYGLNELTALPELSTALRKPSEAIEQQSNTQSLRNERSTEDSPPLSAKASLSCGEL